MEENSLMLNLRFLKTRLAMGGALAATILSGSGAMAHHAGLGFDVAHPYIFHGTVKKFAWSNPHAWLFIEVAKSDGTTELWGFEAGGPNALDRAGWHKNDIPEGAKVTVIGAASRDASKHLGSLQKVILPDGRTLGTEAPPPGAPKGPPPGGPLPGLSPVGAPTEYK
jgi:hypothetical protein